MKSRVNVCFDLDAAMPKTSRPLTQGTIWQSQITHMAEARKKGKVVFLRSDCVYS